jgi:hypothetical protein
MAADPVIDAPTTNPGTGEAYPEGTQWLWGEDKVIIFRNGKWEYKQTAAKEAETNSTNAAQTGSGFQPVKSTNTGLPKQFDRPTAYDLTTAPTYILGSLPPVERDQVLKTLFERGQYGGAKMQNGLGASDISAFQDLLYYANINNLDGQWQKALELYKQKFPINTSLQAGSGSKVPRQVTNPDDLKAVFKKASQDLLGRTLDDKFAEQFVTSFQNQQVQQQTQMDTQSGGVVVQAPDAGVSAENMIEQKFGQEVRVQNAVNFGNIMDQMIKGLAR